MKIYLVNIDNRCIAISSNPLTYRDYWQHDVNALHKNTFINLFRVNSCSKERQEFLEYLFRNIPVNKLIMWDL